MSDASDSLNDFLDGLLTAPEPVNNGTQEPLFGEIIEEPIDLDRPMSEPEPLKFDDEIKGDGECIVCGAPTFRPPGLTKGGQRRRVPKYCDLHNPNVRVPEERSSPKGVGPELRNIQEELADDIRLLAIMAGPLLPVTGMYVFEQSDQFTAAVIKLAKNNVRIIRVLHRAAQIAPIYTVGQVLAGTAYAVQVDMKGADPHNTIARRLEVEKAYDMVYPPEQERADQTQSFTPPPRYNGVQ